MAINLLTGKHTQSDWSCNIGSDAAVKKPSMVQPPTVSGKQATHTKPPKPRHQGESVRRVRIPDVSGHALAYDALGKAEIVDLPRKRR